MVLLVVIVGIVPAAQVGHAFETVAASRASTVLRLLTSRLVTQPVRCAATLAVSEIPAELGERASAVVDKLPETGRRAAIVGVVFAVVILVGERRNRQAEVELTHDTVEIDGALG